MEWDTLTPGTALLMCSSLPLSGSATMMCSGFAQSVWRMPFARATPMFPPPMMAIFLLFMMVPCV